ncbi:uncharacterized protein DUF4402 [Chitinophaga dinghuensis]|uniref:Uncharacterized protein DUF4402 n=1 Tax=Chitinophaga dinghuensis TaxID=1539050 RepID=A0A327VZV4_9BACT|nr:DUF4402 domain-containing protein [Chitinophaga dinghuensis]RAJ82022.1 uncharacterized protein DUF4402 [Chitinophaga dinghuensis]
MKKKLLSLMVAFLAIAAGNAVAQTSGNASANAAAGLITPIAITKTVDMNFGTLGPSGTGNGTLKLSPSGMRTTTGGVAVLANHGISTPAVFDVTGEDGYSFAITLPTIPFVLINGAQVMWATNFTSFPSGSAVITSGQIALNVGATLNVAMNQAPGTYTSLTPFPVTVNYN